MVTLSNASGIAVCSPAYVFLTFTPNYRFEKRGIGIVDVALKVLFNLFDNLFRNKSYEFPNLIFDPSTSQNGPSQNGLN